MEIVGSPPELAGLQCEALICEAFIHKGGLRATANTVHLCFAGIWYRLIIDCGVIFWRQSMGAPKPWAIDDLGFQYPHADVGKVAGVIGRRLRHYRMDSTLSGVAVTFSFDNGREIVIDNADDQTTFRIA